MADVLVVYTLREWVVMPQVFNFYMDESGSRHPNRRSEEDKGRPDFFAMGGVIVPEEHEAEVRRMHSAFCARWGIEKPLHSCEIRNQAKNFQWLRQVQAEKREQFYAELEEFLLNTPVLGLACVIDRPGHQQAYGSVYPDRWSLCKTAFCIAVERAAKHAAGEGRRLRVLPERCNKKDDKNLNGYYTFLKQNGSPFHVQRSARYEPFSAEDYATVLYEFRTKRKTSPLAQLADLYLWPMCMAGYRQDYRPYRKLVEAGKLLDCLHDLEARERLGSKYICLGNREGQTAIQV